MQTPADAPQRRWRNRALVRERDELQSRWLWLILIGIIAALVPAGAHLVFQNARVKSDYQLDALRSENERLLKEERRLRNDRSQLECLEVIETWAANDTPLTRPETESIFVLHGTPIESTELLARADSIAERTSR